MNRRHFLRTSLAAGAALRSLTHFAQGADPSAAVEQAHAELWRRFIDKYGIMLDFTDLDGKVDLPTPEECREGKPNALGWWAPIENGAMFNGLYLDGAVQRWLHTKAEADKAKARKLVEGLLYLNSISEVKGFVGRGVTTDGKSHYPMGSNDQTMPWYYGLWRYLHAGLASPEEKQRIVQHLTETTDAIIKLGWRMPAEAPFGTRGSFGGFAFDEVPRQLFVLKAMHSITGDAKWDTMYREALNQRGGSEKASKLDVCEKGMMVFHYAKTHNWTSCTAVSGLRGLWELEQDPTIKAAYANGLKASAALASESLAEAVKFNAKDGTTFNMDWRASMMPAWKSQQTEQEAQDLAHVQLKEFMKASPRRGKETAFVREPTSAAWIVTLCPDVEVVRSHAAAIEKVVASYDYRQLYYSTFFWVEGAWWRLQDARRA